MGDELAIYSSFSCLNLMNLEGLINFFSGSSIAAHLLPNHDHGSARNWSDGPSLSRSSALESPIWTNAIYSFKGARRSFHNAQILVAKLRELLPILSHPPQVAEHILVKVLLCLLLPIMPVSNPQSCKTAAGWINLLLHYDVPLEVQTLHLESNQYYCKSSKVG